MLFIAAVKMDLRNMLSSTFFRTSFKTMKSKLFATTNLPTISPKLLGAFGKSMPISSNNEPYRRQPVPMSLVVKTFLFSKNSRSCMTGSTHGGIFSRARAIASLTTSGW
ncbi:hypothetical protein CICLE_v10009981mg [Citrus x clementina]|uniref:Uncharacterized protein n=1 Tax=Citrus clementina TaxID=85681 RepID=V4UMA3_CITCL|nr:hypothetical protein CICLE_v10009981mg [Citrus x clementina]